MDEPCEAMLAVVGNPRVVDPLENLGVPAEVTIDEVLGI